ncbi:MAG: preprotein translocase subunit SecE [Thermoguttaceae bacterium]|nr:preprotein translocase subunit SecE [Thermoguttaceae bacterium]
MFRTTLFKRNQGRIVRQVTFIAVAVAVALGLWRMNATFSQEVGATIRYILTGILLVAGLWIAYRLVNVPQFADFLIAVEAEMAKVSWPTRTEVYRSSVVVLLMIFSLAVVLFVFDFLWSQLFQWIGVL